MYVEKRVWKVTLFINEYLFRIFLTLEGKCRLYLLRYRGFPKSSTFFSNWRGSYNSFFGTNTPRLRSNSNFPFLASISREYECVPRFPLARFHPNFRPFPVFPVSLSLLMSKKYICSFVIFGLKKEMETACVIS